MNTFQGLVYVKHAGVGTKNEGPAYFLQTAHADLVLDYHPRQPWQTDFELEFYGRRMVEVRGTYDAERGVLYIEKNGIKEVLSTAIPQVAAPVPSEARRDVLPGGGGDGPGPFRH